MTEGESEPAVMSATDYALFLLDSRGRVTTWNAGAERIMGFRADQIVGRDFSRFYPTEDVRDGTPARELERAVAEGRFEDEGWRLREDGSRFWANVTITALRDRDGRLTGFAKVARDLTQAGHAAREREQLLREQEARAAAEASEKNYRALADAIPHIVWTAGHDGAVDFFNDRVAGYSGLPLEQLRGEGWQLIIHPDDLPRLVELWARARQRGTVLETEQRMRRADGIYRWHLNRAVPAHHPASGELRWFGTCTDIDDLKGAELAIGDSRRWLATTVESINEGLIATDPLGRVRLLNPTAKELTGWSPDEAEGRALETVFEIVDELSRAPRESPVARVLREGAFAGLANRALLVERNGTERTIEYSGAPIRGEDGSILGVVVCFRDMTPRRQAEAVLARLAAIVESSDDAIVGEDLDGTIVTWNDGARRIFGYAPEEVIGRPITVLVPPDLAHEVSALQAAVRCGERVEQLKTRRARKDGSAVDVSVTLSAIRDKFGRVIGVSQIARDIGARKQAEEALERHASRLENLRAIDLAILAARSHEEISKAALEHLARLVPCGRGSILLFDDEARAILTSSSVGWIDERDRPGTRRPLDAIAAADLDALRQGRIYFVEDLAADLDALRQGRDDLAGESQDVPTTSPASELLWAEGIRSYVRFPLTDQGRLFGALNVFSDRPSAYSSDSIEIICEVADQLAIAIRHAQLFEEVRAARGRLEDLSRRLIHAQEDERSHIARELHDEIGQALTAVKIHLQGMTRSPEPVAAEARSRLEECIALIERTLGQVRGIALDLRPSLLDDLGLVAALRSHVNLQARMAGFAAEFTADGPEGRLGPALETACFRVAQEALTNIVRHAGAGHVSVEVHRDDDTLHLVVRDDGVGFDPSSVRTRAEGTSMGLLGMQERAALIGGQLAIHSEPGRGTMIRARFPLPAPLAKSVGGR
jgi:PAS domain S-box-containing protein